jgi:hypothetical protein
LTITNLDLGNLADLVSAAAVPIGFESAPPADFTMTPVLATGRPLVAVLDALVAADPRYEWREDRGVILIRPRESWQTAGPLDTPIEPLKLSDIQAIDALIVLARMVGSIPNVGGPLDATRFSIDVPAGARFLDLLNAIVRAHGTLLWTLSYNTSPAPDSAFPMHLFLDRSGFGIRRGAVVNGSPLVLPPGRADGPVLDRIIGPLRDGRPFEMRSFWNMAGLAGVINAPVGAELFSRFLPGPLPSREVLTATGLQVEDALLMLRGMDPRYEYRELDGVIVVRPSGAWDDNDQFLSMPVKSIPFENVTAGDVITSIYNLFGILPRRTSSGFPDTRRFSLRFPGGTMFDLLNAFARAHGSIAWQLEHHTDEERRSRNRRYTLEFTTGTGVMMGFPIP